MNVVRLPWRMLITLVTTLTFDAFIFLSWLNLTSSRSTSNVDGGSFDGVTAEPSINFNSSASLEAMLICNKN